MRNFVLGVICTVAVFIVGALAYLLLGFAEVRGDVPGTQLESRLMTATVHASVRRHAPELVNPFPPSDETLVAGGKIFLNECAGCHGAPGKVTDYSDTLYPPAPQLPKVGTQYTEAQIFWIAKYGIRRTGMFANGKWESDEKLWKAAAFIKRIKELPPPVEQAVAKMAAGN
jgi:mono/diheme cytochrome c family protein